MQMVFDAADGYGLVGRFYEHQGDAKPYPVLIAPATGITQGFYKKFVEYLTAQGYDVMSFDFRGIGASLHGKLKDSTASISDWGVYDLPAAIDALLAKTSAKRLILIGHSAGAQLLGVAHNHHRVAKLISVAGSTGHVPQLSGRTRLLAPVMFDVIFRISSLTLGYGATKFIGMGENLPKQVARQWREFCQSGQYIKSAIGKSIRDDYHDQVNCAMAAFYASDDEIATEANVRDLFALYPQATISYHRLEPAAFGLSDIGHMKLFRPSHRVLWDLVLDAMNDVQ